MREIKFRHWCKSAGKFFYNEIAMECLMQQNLWNRQGGYPAFNHVGLGDAFEQYTGLRDKAHIYIYEGDIVQWYDFDTLLEIKHCEHHAQILIGKDMLTKGYAMESVIVGNIRENPELLEGK